VSAYILDKEDVDKLVYAALRAYPAGQPGSSLRLSWWRVDEEGKYEGWRELNQHAEQMIDDDYKAYYTPSQLGQILVNENVASVSYRYSTPGRTGYYGAEAAAAMEDNEDDILPGPCDRYYMAPYVYTEPRWQPTPGQVFSLIDCLDYQSCEHDGWRSSEAFAFLTALREAWCRRVIEAERVGV
jgi:hypothetical protein